jgi:hypothetical protein
VQDAVTIGQRHEWLPDSPQGAGHGRGDLVVVVLFDVDEVGVAHAREDRFRVALRAPAEAADAPQQAERGQVREGNRFHRLAHDRWGLGHIGVAEEAGVIVGLQLVDAHGHASDLCCIWFCVSLGP